IVQLGFFGGFHVDSGFRVEHRAADAVPVEPSSKISLGQSIGRYDVVDHEVGDVETSETGGSSSQPPLANFLAEQRPSLATKTVVPQTGPSERVASKRHVHSERNLSAKLDYLGTVVEQRDHTPMTSAAIWKPGGTSPSPNRHHLSANVIAMTEQQTF